MTALHRLSLPSTDKILLLKQTEKNKIFNTCVLNAVKHVYTFTHCIRWTSQKPRQHLSVQGQERVLTEIRSSLTHMETQFSPFNPVLCAQFTKWLQA